jgi:hypothetical protein
MLGPDACVTLEGARSKGFEDLEFQEQELKTLITINITFLYACMSPNFDGS